MLAGQARAQQRSARVAGCVRVLRASETESAIARIWSALGVRPEAACWVEAATEASVRGGEEATKGTLTKNEAATCTHERPVVSKGEKPEEAKPKTQAKKAAGVIHHGGAPEGSQRG